MTPRITAALVVATLTLTGCASRLNPLNWFGGDREERITVEEPAPDILDYRLLVPEVTELSVDSTPGGAIVRAVGLPPRQGFWQADLVETGREDGQLIFEFRVFEPQEVNTPVGQPRAREIYAATSLSRQDLAGIRSITVIAAQNRRSVRRR